MRSKRPLISMSQVQLVYKSMFCQNVISAVWCEPPAWLALNARVADDEADSREDQVYHSPVLQAEVLRFLKPKLGSLVVDATCGDVGHTDALLQSRADVMPLDHYAE